MEKVHIVQCLCPARHCFAAVLYQAPTTGEEAVAALTALATRGSHCGIGGSRQLIYEDRETSYTDMAVAGAEMRRGQAEQLATRRFLEQRGLTYDSQQGGRPGKKGRPR